MIPFVGPSYNLRSRKADVQRSINLIPLPIEPGNTKAGWVFKDAPGLIVKYSLPGPIRCAESCLGLVFVVASGTLYKLKADGTSSAIGTLLTIVGRVTIKFNTTQLIVADEANLYVMPFATGVLSPVAGYPGNSFIDYINQYIVFILRGTQQFGWTKIGDATSIDALDFASAEGSPDNLVGLIVDHQDLILVGTNSVEPWVNTGDTNIFQRRPGGFAETGCAAGATVKKVDGSVFWLGADDRGQGIVWRLGTGYAPVRVSTQAIEEHLQGIDISAAASFSYQMDGSTFYCLNVPGLNSTLVYDVLSGLWHERAELVNDEFRPHRATCHVYGFNTHMIGAEDGNIYALDPTVHNNAGDVLCRSRITPANATPVSQRIDYGAFHVSGDAGYGGTALMRASNNGGATFGSWRQASMGAVGEFERITRWPRCGSSLNRVWEVRVTDDVPWNPVSAGVDPE